MVSVVSLGKFEWFESNSKTERLRYSYGNNMVPGPYDHMCDAFALKNLGKSSEKSVVA